MLDQTSVRVAKDQELVRLIIVQALLDEGFEVMEAERAEAALIVLESHTRRIQVSFTDIQMPGTMDGLAPAHHTSKHWPRIGLLVTSARLDPDRATFPKESRFVAKPYRHPMAFVIFASWRRLDASHGGDSGAGPDASLRRQRHS